MRHLYLGGDATFELGIDKDSIERWLSLVRHDACQTSRKWIYQHVLLTSIRLNQRKSFCIFDAEKILFQQQVEPCLVDDSVCEKRHARA